MALSTSLQQLAGAAIQRREIPEKQGNSELIQSIVKDGPTDLR